MENEKIKTSRASSTRVKEAKKTTWTPPSSLDAPPAPNGYRHRWIRAETMGFDDTKNMVGKLRSGWELVRADEYPETDYPTMKDGKYAGVIQWEAYCWLGYLKKSRSHVNLILQNKLRIKMTQLKTTFLRNSTQVCQSMMKGKLV